MKVAIDISPLSSGHKVRGVGFYLLHLKTALEKYFPANSYLYFTQSQKVPNEANIVHYPYFDPFFISLPFFKKYKTVVTVHDLIPLVLPQLFPSGIKGKIKWYFQKRSLQKVDAIITDSVASQKDIARFANVPEKKIHVAYLAAGEEFGKTENKKQITELRKKYHLPEKFALYVGDVTANKNLPRIVKAALRANVTLIMVGKSLVTEKIDKNNAWMKDLVEVQALAKNNSQILRLGFVNDEDLVALYNAATVFVMPSLYEGFGLPIIEAMASGCPVITSKEGSLAEVAGEAAYIVDAYSIESIAEGIQKVVGDKQLQKKLSEKGLEQSKKFFWEKTAAETVKVYSVITG